MSSWHESEILRVADRLRALRQPDGHTTYGDLARRTSSGVLVVVEAATHNASVADAFAEMVGSLR